MSIRKLSVDFAFYGLLDLLQRSVGLIMVPLYTRILSQQQYGELDMLLVMISIFTVLVDLQFVAGFSRFYLEYANRGDGKRFAGTIVMVRLTAGCAIALLAFVAGTAGYLDWDAVPRFRDNVTAWGLVLLMVPLTLLHDILLLQARMLRWKRPFAMGALSGVMGSTVASVVFAVLLGWGTVGILLGLVIGKAVGLAVLGWSVRREIKLGFDRAVLAPLLGYTMPLVPGWWLGFASSYIGRFFVYGIQGADDNALLAVSMKLTSVIGLFAISFRSAWLPLAMSYIGDASGERFYVRSMRLFMAGSFGSTLCLAAFLHPVLAILAPGSYGPVELYFPLFGVATLIAECESNLQLGNQIAKKTMWISAGSFVYLVVNVALLWALTARYGVAAAGLGLLVASLARTLVTYVSAQINWPIPYDRRAMALFIAGCAAFLTFGAGLAIDIVPGWVPRTAMLATGVLVPWLMLERQERQLILAAASARWNRT